MLDVICYVLYVILTYIEAAQGRRHGLVLRPGEYNFLSAALAICVCIYIYIYLCLSLSLYIYIYIYVYFSLYIYIYI